MLIFVKNIILLHIILKKNELLKIAVRLIQDIKRADATLFL